MAELFEVRGKGKNHRVHAVEALAKGEELCTFSGKPVDFKETLELGSRESFAFQVGRNLYIYLDEPYRYFNHSCDPNCGITPDLKMITLKQVAKDEELRWDYSTSMLEHHWTMECECGEQNCRHIIGDFNTVPKKQQRYYLDQNVVQQFIVDILEIK